MKDTQFYAVYGWIVKKGFPGRMQDIYARIYSFNRNGEACTRNAAGLAEDVGIDASNVRRSIQKMIESGDIRRDENGGLWVCENAQNARETCKMHDLEDAKCTPETCIMHEKTRKMHDSQSDAYPYLKDLNNSIKEDKSTERETTRARKRGATADAGRSLFIPPTFEEVQTYADENRLNSKEKEIEKFLNTFAATGWTLRGSPVRDWKALFRLWDARGEERAEKERKQKEGRTSIFDL